MTQPRFLVPPWLPYAEHTVALARSLRRLRGAHAGGFYHLALLASGPELRPFPLSLPEHLAGVRAVVLVEDDGSQPVAEVADRALNALSLESQYRPAYATFSC